MSALPRFDNPTPYDLRFTLLGIPVRIHPLFWLMILILCYVGDAKLLAIRLPAAALSILIHEYGHALMMRWYGHRPNIVLYMLGGYAQYSKQRYDWIEEPEGRLSEDLTITFAGPIAPLIVSAVIGLALFFLGAMFFVAPMPEAPFLYVIFRGLPDWAGADMVLEFLNQFVNITLLWSFFNLLPILPLDGGQILRAILRHRNTPRYEEIACWVSIVTALSLFGLTFILSAGLPSNGVPNAMLLLSLAGLNYSMAQQYRQRGNF